MSFRGKKIGAFQKVGEKLGKGHFNFLVLFMAMLAYASVGKVRKLDQYNLLWMVFPHDA